MRSFFTHLACTRCDRTFDRHERCELCGCGAPLFACYDIAAARRHWSKADLLHAPASLWRYAPMLPVLEDKHRISLGEGWTPLLPVERLAAQFGLAHLWIKDESPNPTASFKARGMSLAISRARELGVQQVAVPSAGNAGSAVAAYAAAAGMPAYVFMPKDVPAAFRHECEFYGAHLELVEGLITDCAKQVLAGKATQGWFDLSTLKEPYRVEGKKTMGYELAEQFDWQLPDVIIYPTGGGTGLIGMWKAFDELEGLGWIGARRPRMVAVQSQGCAPIIRAFEKGLDYAPEWPHAATVASGLRVPRAVGDFLMLHILRASHGTAVAVAEDAIAPATRAYSRATGIFFCPEGAAALEAARMLAAAGWIKPQERVVVFNTGSGLKYADALS
ncbi:MAG: threonine synthase [candidate division KSB1 bacterium]|nr:threonine synthase [candidate division KSB1 bacterium]MDZ7272925.1 threonine synthase [candidate division KSB1 bacterium]MDZ7284053.1 threonine synthase [candidate division KSB1 bacterium]MDZ7297550.1 threonine synthase [candidate division KSB1 bacterium]MDZ7308929.1 threonine synthase [candidate division KSB1 bacterium]